MLRLHGASGEMSGRQLVGYKDVCLLEKSNVWEKKLGVVIK